MWASFLSVAQGRETQTAISDESAACTYGQLIQGAIDLGKHITPPRRAVVLVMLPNCPEFVVALLAIWRVNGMAIPVDPVEGENQLDRIVKQVRPTHIITKDVKSRARNTVDTVWIEMNREGILICKTSNFNSSSCAVDFRPELPDNLPPDAAMVQYTSGTTGKPKAILHTQNALISNIEKWRDFTPNSHAVTSVFCPMPQHHAMGFAVTLECLWNGIALHVRNRFLPASDIGIVNRNNCEILVANPGYISLLDSLNALKREILPSLRTIIIGSDAVGDKLIQKLLASFPDATVCLRYGLSELVGPISMMAYQSGMQPSFGLVGKLVCGVEYKIPNRLPANETGVLWVKSDRNSIGSLDEKGEHIVETTDGYLNTDDMGYIDENSYLNILGRENNLIKCNGYRISPYEIEKVLRNIIPEIQDAIVIGTETDLGTELITACLEKKQKCMLPSYEEIRLRCEQHLSPYKIPKRFREFDKFPRTASGKVNRKQLRSVF